MGHTRVPVVSERRSNLVYSSIAGLILLSGCVTTSTISEMSWVRTDGRKIADDPRYCSKGRAILLIAMPISIAERQPHRRADAWPRRGTCLCKGSGRGRARGIRRRCNAVLRTDNYRS